MDKQLPTTAGSSEEPISTSSNSKIEKERQVTTTRNNIWKILNWHTCIATFFTINATVVGILHKRYSDGFTEQQQAIHEYIEKAIAQPFLFYYSIVLTFTSLILYFILCFGYKMMEIDFPGEERPIKRAWIPFGIIVLGLNTYHTVRVLFISPSTYIMFYFYNLFFYNTISLTEAAIVLVIMLAFYHARKVFLMMFRVSFYYPTYHCVYLAYSIFTKAKKRRYETVAAADAMV